MREIVAKTLAEIVTSNHHAAAIFEKYDLDFCCKGQRTLQKACEEKNLAVEQLVQEIELSNHTKLSAGSIDFEKLSLAQLSEYIINTHHDFVKRELPVIMDLMEKIVVKYGERHPETIKVFALFAAIREEMEYHMHKEETVLFPRIREIERFIEDGKEIVINNTYLLAHVNMMSQEHEHSASMINEIKILSDNYNPPPDACTLFRLGYSSLQAFELDLHKHVHLENNLLFPKALRMFDMERICSLN